MTDQNELTKVYKQNLEESIVTYISEEKNIPIEKALDVFYRSKLSEQIHEGKYGIENLDYESLAEALILNETALFETRRTYTLYDSTEPADSRLDLDLEP